ncbi:MAG: hypothetical protein MI919_20945, partial [Holophagales bacterium]|nr:hypothetical protein [Holophagales bacterium]
ALHGPLASLALALFAASVSLLLRLRRHSPRLEPRGSASLVLLGPILGIWAAVGLRTLGTATLEMLTVGRLPLEALALETQPRTPDEAGRREHARLCHELEDAWGRDLAPLVRGLEIERLDTLESLGRRLAATPGVWASAETSAEVRAACLPAASLLGGAVATAPTPVSLVRTVFEHPSRPEGAGELARDLLRDPRHACRLHRVSTSTVRELSARLEEAAPQAAADLRHALEERRSRLEQSWLEGWLLRCGVRSPAEHPGLPAVEVRLTAPPGLEAGRPDLWLGLPRAAAAKLAENLAACSLRPPHDGRQRRWQAFDCVLLGRSSRDGELAILAELGLVYASNPREKAEDPLQAIPAGSRPQTLRLLLDAEGSGDLHARATASLRSFGRALTAAGGGLEPPPGIDPGDSSGWRFGLRSGADRLEGTISKRILPGGREGMLFVLRRPGGVP